MASDMISHLYDFYLQPSYNLLDAHSCELGIHLT